MTTASTASKPVFLDGDQIKACTEFYAQDCTLKTVIDTSIDNLLCGGVFITKGGDDFQSVYGKGSGASRLVNSIWRQWAMRLIQNLWLYGICFSVMVDDDDDDDEQPPQETEAGVEEEEEGQNTTRPKKRAKRHKNKNKNKNKNLYPRVLDINKLLVRMQPDTLCDNQQFRLFCVDVNQQWMEIKNFKVFSIELPSSDGRINSKALRLLPKYLEMVKIKNIYMTVMQKNLFPVHLLEKTKDRFDPANSGINDIPAAITPDVSSLSRQRLSLEDAIRYSQFQERDRMANMHHSDYLDPKYNDFRFKQLPVAALIRGYEPVHELGSGLTYKEAAEVKGPLKDALEMYIEDYGRSVTGMFTVQSSLILPARFSADNDSMGFQQRLLDAQCSRRLDVSNMILSMYRQKKTIEAREIEFGTVVADWYTTLFLSEAEQGEQGNGSDDDDDDDDDDDEKLQVWFPGVPPLETVERWTDAGFLKFKTTVKILSKASGIPENSFETERRMDEFNVAVPVDPNAQEKNAKPVNKTKKKKP